MQRFKRSFSFLAVLAFVLIVISPLSVKADKYGEYVKTNGTTQSEARVLDDAGLFKSSEAKAILEEAYNITDYADMYVVTVPKNGNSYGSTESATDRYCDEVYKTVSGANNCVIFCIDMDTRYLLVYSKGQIESDLSGSKADTITDNVYSYASDGDYYGCSLKAIEQIGKVLAGMHIAQPMKVASNLFIAFVVGFVIMYLIALGKSKVRKTSDSEMLKFAAIRFAANNPKDIITGTTKTYCPRSSGGGGGRGGGGGGGHSSGGHRF